MSNVPSLRQNISPADLNKAREEGGWYNAEGADEDDYL